MTKQIVALLFRRKADILSVFLGIVAFTMLFAYIWPPEYEASATLVLTPGRYKKPFLPEERDTRTSYLQVSMEDVGSEVLLITSYPVVSRAVERTKLHQKKRPDGSKPIKQVAWYIKKGLKETVIFLGLKPRLSPFEEAVGGLKNEIEVEYIKRTNIIEVSWRSTSPKLASNVVNAVVDEYITHHISIYGNAYAKELVKSMVTNSWDQLAAMEDSLKAYKVAHSLSDVDGEYEEVLAKLIEAESKYMLLKRMKTDSLPSTELANLSGDPVFLQLMNRHTDAQLEYVDLRTRYGPTDRKVVAVKKELVELQKLIKERYETSLSTWQSMVYHYRQQLRRLENQKTRVEHIKRRIENLRKMYELNQEKSNEIFISTAMDNASIASVRVVEYAHPSEKPAFPKRMLLLIVSLFMGGVFGLTFGILKDRLSMRLFSVEDVESASGVPVPVSIPDFSRGKKKNRTVVTPRALARYLIPIERMVESEACGPTALLLTSPSRETGTSLLCSALSGLLSHGGEDRTLCVSVHTRPVSGLHIPLGEAVMPEQFQAALRRSDDDTFDTITLVTGGDGGIPVQSRVDRLFEQIHAHGYRYVCIDIIAPDADPVYLPFTKRVDHVFVVTAYNLTRRFALVRMIDVMQRLGVSVSGCLFNKRVNEIPEPIYRYIL